MAKHKQRHVVNLSVLPGQPTDGSGRVCIHLFVPSEKGLFVEPSVLYPVIGADGLPVKQQLQSRPTRGMLACDPKRMVAPVVRSGVTIITMRTDSTDAVTCPKCIASEHYRAAVERQTINGG